MRKDRRESTHGLVIEAGEQGFMLVGLIVAIFLILLALSVAAPKVAQDLRRDREVEAVRRGNQYVRAIQLYYRKTKTYPGSIEQLEKTNNTRFLRQRYVDPITGKDDWRLIHIGEAKTTVKGFFGQPLAGLAPGLGSATGLNSGFGGQAGAGGTGFGASTSGGLGASSSSGGLGASSSPGGGGLGSSSAPTLGGTSTTGGTAAGPGAATAGTPGTDAAGAPGAGTAGAGTPASSSGFGNQSAFSGGGAPFVGVGVPKEAESITILNEQTTYNTWEFIYDPRIEQMKARASLFGGGPTSGSPGLGSAAGNSSGFGSTPGTGFGASPTTPTTGPGAPTLGAPPASPTTPTTPQQ